MLRCLTRESDRVPGRIPFLCVAVLVSATGVGLAPPASAQQGTAVILGQVLDGRSHAPIPDAVLVLAGTAWRTTSDSIGRFTHAGLAAGTYALEARAIGYAMGSWMIELAEGDSLRHVFELELAEYDLPAVVTIGEAGPTDLSLREFERRRASGRGVFITREEIERRRPATLVDLLRNIPGVRTLCARGGCAVRMMRTPRGCRPDILMDGFPATLSMQPDTRADDIIAVEVYRSVSETPGELLHADNRCGVIAIWTRTGQSRPR
ncbi:MAG: carboxypeptidase regulatory-like domain-containing protein [Gemmatimonadales bacterium]